VSLLASSALFPDVLRADPGVGVLFAGRAEGNASLNVGEDGIHGRRAALAKLGRHPGDAVFMEQVHGGHVARVGHADRGRGAAGGGSAIPGVDALVTTDPGVALVVLSADCVPVLLLDPGRGVGAVHAGRRGVCSAVVTAAVEALTAATGSLPSRLHALIGPSIGGCCYEVPVRLAVEVTTVAACAAATTRWGTPSLDLPAAVESQLGACGVRSVARVDACTCCTSQRWFSHRAKASGAREGRNASVIVRRQL
jgi:polyphenol oxidase